MHALMERIARIGISLLIKVVLVGGECVLALPFHVFDQAAQPSFDLFFTFRGLVNITDMTCDQPMPCLMDIRLNCYGLACRIPVVFSIFLWGQLCPLGC